MEFEISEKEKDNLNKFLTCHCDNSEYCNFFRVDGSKYTGAIGGAETYHFHPTSIGVVVSVSCPCHEEKVDITDYDVW